MAEWAVRAGTRLAGVRWSHGAGAAPVRRGGGDMAASDRWDPFREMVTVRDAMERLVNESFVRLGSAFSTAGVGWFPVDLADLGDRYLVRAPVPGVKAEDVEVS